ncbi:hypothetical protein FGG08_007497 [Glutinoglossum americanum]|uniref:Alpha/beta hydrolase fold-3 domain-containing protein n=1 Tax=Glutinoglossum americanum TaxID=1670608 RepID=A0A9P8HZB4_9PEZI|nr:hypothetical protein FGG08_007497 [Glutinoglossum americanum]
MATPTTTKTYTYKSCPADQGGDLLADVHWSATPTSSAPPRPIALVLHGGGFVIGSKEMVPAAQIQRLAALGFVVVVPNYRLCPQVSVYDGPVADAQDALAWCRAEVPGLVGGEGVVVDGGRVVAMGHSAGGSLALGLRQGSVPEPVNAILDLYGGKYLTEPAWHQPSVYFAAAPALPDDYTRQIHDGPPISAAPLFFPQPGATAPPPPRNAWMIARMKDGTWLEKVVQDGDYARVDPVTGFAAGFPPTMFVHGTADTVMDYRLSERAFQTLKELGVEVQAEWVEGADHMFDMAGEEGAGGEAVRKGLEFLAKHA